MVDKLNKTLPSTSEVASLYNSKRFVECPEMRKALRGVMQGAQIASFSEDFIAKDSDKRKKIWRIFSFARLRLKTKCVFSPSFKKKFRVAVKEIVGAYQNFHFNKIQASPTENKPPHKTATKEGLRQKWNDLNQKIGEFNKRQVEKADQLKEKNVLLCEKNGKVKASKAEMASEDKKNQWIAQIDFLAQILLEIELFEKAPKKASWVFFTDTTYDKSRMEDVFQRAKITTPFNYDNAEAEKHEFMKQKKCFEQDIVIYEEQKAQLQVFEKEIETLEAEAIQLSNELKAVSLEITKLNVDKAAIEAELEIKSKIKTDDAIPQEPNKINPAQIVEDVLRKINDSIDLDEGSEESRNITKHKQKRYLEKAVKTPNLEMSGVSDAELSMHRMGLIVSTISNAMESQEHNADICMMINNLIQALVLYKAGLTSNDKIKIKEFIEFVFGIDPETQKPRLEEGMRLRVIGSIIGSVMNLTHFFHDPDCLRNAMLKLKECEQNWFKAFLGKTFGPRFVKGHIKATLSLVESIKGHEAYREHQNIMSNTFATIMIEVALGNPNNPGELKANMSKALKSFGDKDLKEFMSQIDVEHEPDVKKIVQDCVKLFDKFSKNLAAA